MNSRQFPRKRALAVAATLLCSNAMAYTPTSNTDADSVIYWGGATASSLSAQELAVNAACDTDADLFYVKATSGSNIDRPGNDWAVACRTAAAGATKTGLPNNKRILIIKRDRGGSGVGVGPVQTKLTDANSGKISFLTINATTCNLTVTPGVNGAPAIPKPDNAAQNINIKGCSATYTTDAYTEMGTSDIEANKFIDINTPNVDSVLLPFRTEADRGFQEEFALAGLAFNHPVTLELFKKLQTAQFAIGSACNPGNAGYTALTVSATDRPDTTNAESEACLPSLSRNQINSILTGQIGDWDSLLDSSGAPLAGLTGNTQICRRVNGSGTQATINAWTSSYACDPNRTDNSVDIIPPLTAATAGVFENSGSGDVDNCLHNINAGTQGTNKFAIGNLSVEGRNVDKARGWRFIKIDGYAPTLANIHDGKYSFWAQQACQRRKESLPYNASVGLDDTVLNKKKVFDSLCSTASTRGLNSISSLTKLNNERNVANCNAGTLAQCGSNYTWGRSGWLATPTSNLVYDNVLAPTTNPVNVYTREISTGKVNICQTPVKSIEGDNLLNGIIVTN